MFLSYVSTKGHALIDRELSLPKDWIDDPGQGGEAGIPEARRFHTKCELACQMVERVWQAQILLACGVVASVYGGNLDLCTFLQYSCVRTVACDEPVGIQATSGLKRMTGAEVETLVLSSPSW